MNKNNFIKVSIAVFVFLGIIISLFPPFEFGKNIKKYDFLFGSIQKYIIVSYYTFQKKFYDKETLSFYKDKWSDKKFQFDSASIDSFFTARIFLYKGNKSLIGKPDSHRYYDFSDKVNIWQGNTASHTGSSYDADNSMNDNGKIIKYDYDKRDAINYDEVKNQYHKSPNDWDFKYVDYFDSSKKFDLYDISKPVYWLLERKILFGELMVEYILAFFVAIIAGYFLHRVRAFIIPRIKTRGYLIKFVITA